MLLLDTALQMNLDCVTTVYTRDEFNPFMFKQQVVLKTKSLALLISGGSFTSDKLEVFHTDFVPSHKVHLQTVSQNAFASI